MTIEQFKQLQAAMPTPELIEKARAWYCKLAETRGEAWTMSIPPNKNDPDMIFSELCRRLEIVSKFDVAFSLVNATQTLLDNLEETHAALCFTPDYIGSLRYEQNKSAIEAAKTKTP